MTLLPWSPDPAPFGNATGFDTVALDVKIAIAISMNMKVYRGELPPDIQAEQEKARAAGRTNERPRPLKAITVSHDGLTISGDYDGRSYVRGYRSSYWLDCLTPETVVFDFRSLTWEDGKLLAIRGPMLGVDLPEGTVSKLGPLDSMMAGVADDYMRSVGTSLEETGAEVA
jgi:hypothetical protein